MDEYKIRAMSLSEETAMISWRDLGKCATSQSVAVSEATIWRTLNLKRPSLSASM